MLPFKRRPEKSSRSTDSDCVCTPQWLSRGVAALLRDPAVGVAARGVLPLTAGNSGPTLADVHAFFHMRQAHYVTNMGSRNGELPCPPRAVR